MAARIKHVMQATFNGRRIVVFSGGEAKDLEGLFTEIRSLRDGGANDSIIGRKHLPAPTRRGDRHARQDHFDLSGQDARTG
jgi:class I fructose-bisphosphate aldolase